MAKAKKKKAPLRRSHTRHTRKADGTPVYIGKSWPGTGISEKLVVGEHETNWLSRDPDGEEYSRRKVSGPYHRRKVTPKKKSTTIKKAKPTKAAADKTRVRRKKKAK